MFNRCLRNSGGGGTHVPCCFRHCQTWIEDFFSILWTAILAWLRRLLLPKISLELYTINFVSRCHDSKASLSQQNLRFFPIRFCEKKVCINPYTSEIPCSSTTRFCGIAVFSHAFLHSHLKKTLFAIILCFVPVNRILSSCHSTFPAQTSRRNDPSVRVGIPYNPPFVPHSVHF